jgi:hypothetical protein
MKSKVLIISLLASLSLGAQAGNVENVVGGVILGAVIANQFSHHDHPYVNLPAPQYVYPPQVVYAPPMPYYPPQVVYSGPQVIYAPQPDYGYGHRHFHEHRDHDWNRGYERGRW